MELNKHALRAMPGSLQLPWLARRVVGRREVVDGSMAHDVLVVADNGKVSRAECAALRLDYIGPSLEYVSPLRAFSREASSFPHSRSPTGPLPTADVGARLTT